MTERFAKATLQTPEGANAQDAGADRLGAYSDAGELHSPQQAVDRDRGGPDSPVPAGMDAEIIFTGGPGRSLGGPHATDRSGEAGSPAGEDAPDPDDVDPADRGHRPGPFVDRLR
jgi:hypothetical protein